MNNSVPNASTAFALSFLRRAVLLIASSFLLLDNSELKITVDPSFSA